MYALGSVALLVIGGLSGVVTGIIPVDWQVHNTYYVVAHIHYVLIGANVFPVFAGLYYWLPEDDRPHDERAARQVELLGHVHRLQLGVLSHAHSRPDGHAPPHLHLCSQSRAAAA